MITSLSTSNFFIMAKRLLEEPDRQWSVYDFKEQKIDKNTVGQILKLLEEDNIVKRNGGRRGQGSSCSLTNPEKLLNLSISNFTNQVMRSKSFVSKSKPPEEIFDELKRKNYELFWGEINGVESRYSHVYDGRISIYTLNSELFKKDVRMDNMFGLGLHESPMGEISFIVPRYKKFLKYDSLENESRPIPSRLYTYLSLKNSKYPMAEAQVNYLEERLKAENQFFV